MEAASVPAEPPGGEQQDQGTDPFAEISSRLDQMQQGMAQTIDERFSQLEGRLPQPQEPEPDPYGGVDPAFFEPADDGSGIDPQQFMQAIQQLADQRAKEAVGPAMQQIAEMRRDSEAKDLESRYPALADPENAQAALQAAQQYAQALGQPGLALEPRMIELAWLAQAGSRLAQSEVPAGGHQGAPLERAGGAGPGQQEQPSLTDRLWGADDNGLSNFWRS